MADTAAHLVDRVIPEAPVRQWVLTLPYPLRYRCAWDAKLTTKVLRAFLRALFADQRRRAHLHHGIRNGLCASITFIQRFGSALNLAPHFHSLVLDGVYAGPAANPGPFFPLPPPETEEVARVMAGTAQRVKRLLEKQNLEQSDDPLSADDPLLAMLMVASVRSRIATGNEAGLPWRRLGDRVEPLNAVEGASSKTDDTPPRCVRHGGMSLHADVAVPARDRARLERLCRYVARPPIATERLEALPNGRLAYRLKTPWRDGTTHILMERHELLERLAPLIPPPRAHQVRYHGVFAPCASGRDRVVPTVTESEPNAGATPPEPEGGSHAETAGTDPRAQPTGGLWNRPNGERTTPDAMVLPTVRALINAKKEPVSIPSPATAVLRSPRRHPWADLLQRVFEVDALSCPRCGGKMRILSAITEAEVARRILECLALPTRAPPIARATDSFEMRFRPDQPAHEQQIDVSEFDQRQPKEWGFGA